MTTCRFLNLLDSSESTQICYECSVTVAQQQHSKAIFEEYDSALLDMDHLDIVEYFHTAPVMEESLIKIQSKYRNGARKVYIEIMRLKHAMILSTVHSSTTCQYQMDIWH